MRFAKNKVQLAAELEVSRQTIYRWIQEGAPPATRKGYDVTKWIEWIGEAHPDYFSIEADLRREEIALRRAIREAEKAF